LRKEFKVKLFGCGRSGQVAGMNLPFDPQKVWGKSRLPVTGTINGFKFRTTVCPMRGEYFVCVNQQMREGGKCGVDDTVKVVMEPDTAPRTVEAPPDQSAEDQQDGAGGMGALFLHESQGIRAVDYHGQEAGDACRRLEKAVDMLAAGRNLGQR
jgi:hypothetical protein